MRFREPDLGGKARIGARRRRASPSPARWYRGRALGHELSSMIMLLLMMVVTIMVMLVIMMMVMMMVMHRSYKGSAHSAVAYY